MFTDELRADTKRLHTIVDKSPFVQLIREHKDVGKLYINFNKICIHLFQQRLDDSLGQYRNGFKRIYLKLYRKDLSLVDVFISTNLSKLLRRCEEFPLEHAYMFYLGLLNGGNILSKSLPQHLEFLKFGEPATDLIKEFKDYLNESVTTQTEKDIFTARVNESYRIIKLVFDDYYKKKTEFEATVYC